MSGSGKRFTMAELAQCVGGELRGSAEIAVTGVNTLTDAQPGDITFITNRRYASEWSQSKAGAALVSRGLEEMVADQDTSDRAIIIVKDAEQAMNRLLDLFATPERVPDLGVHPTAFVHADAVLGQQARIGPHVSVDAGSRIGNGVVLHAGVRVYANVTIGAGSILHANVVLRENTQIGRGVILHQNVSIGADGFGYRPDPSGKAGLLKIQHIGNVVIEDEVEIGANTCVDRGKFGSTIIGAGTKIDNLCQIGHNCRIGRCCVIAGQTGLAGSVTVGDGVQMGGRAGAADHLHIGKGAKIGANSVATRDIPDGAVWLGYPADNAQSVLRQWAAIRKLPDLFRRLKES